MISANSIADIVYWLLFNILKHSYNSNWKMFVNLKLMQNGIVCGFAFHSPSVSAKRVAYQTPMKLKIRKIFTCSKAWNVSWMLTTVKWALFRFKSSCILHTTDRNCPSALCLVVTTHILWHPLELSGRWKCFRRFFFSFN